MIRLLLVALDDSPRARGVVRAAEELAHAFGAKVHLLRVVDLPQEIPPAAHVVPDELEGLLVRRAEEDLRSCAERFADASIEVVADSGGRPWKLVIAAAERANADVIVIGSHGFGGLDRLFGTNTARIADRASRHVFVVHEKR